MLPLPVCPVSSWLYCPTLIRECQLDRRDGKQAIEVKGGLVHAHTAYRDPQLAALSPEELAASTLLQKSSRYRRRMPRKIK
jgi:hypothetical protein